MIAAILGVVGVILVIGIIVAGVLISGGGKSNTVGGTPSPSYQTGGIVFSPQTFACDANVTITATIRLPASVDGTTTVTFYNDGVSETTLQVSDRFTKNSDNSW
ncbi:MAG TPA: hypothetical protein VF337_12475, partial [Candidatus Limnocylindrales bacterium]